MATAKQATAQVQWTAKRGLSIYGKKTSVLQDDFESLRSVIYKYCIIIIIKTVREATWGAASLPLEQLRFQSVSFAQWISRGIRYLFHCWGILSKQQSQLYKFLCRLSSWFILVFLLFQLTDRNVFNLFTLGYGYNISFPTSYFCDAWQRCPGLRFFR